MSGRSEDAVEGRSPDVPGSIPSYNGCMSTIQESTNAVPETAGELAERLFNATLGALELLSVHVGRRLDLYPLIASKGPLTFSQLAREAGIDERYAQEWLEQQAAAGLLGVGDDAAPARDRSYFMPAGHDEVLVDPTSANYVALLSAMVAGIAARRPRGCRRLPHRRRSALSALRSRLPGGPGRRQPTRL